MDRENLVLIFYREDDRQDLGATIRTAATSRHALARSYVLRRATLWRNDEMSAW